MYQEKSKLYHLSCLNFVHSISSWLLPFFTFSAWSSSGRVSKNIHVLETRTNWCLCHARYSYTVLSNDWKKWKIMIRILRRKCFYTPTPGMTLAVPPGTHVTFRTIIRIGIVVAIHRGELHIMMTCQWVTSSSLRLAHCVQNIRLVFVTDCKLLIRLVLDSSLKVFENDKQLLTPLRCQGMYLIQTQEELAIKISESLLIDIPVAIEVHTSIHATQEDRPAASVIFLIAGHFKWLRTIAGNEYLVDTALFIWTGNCFSTIGSIRCQVWFAQLFQQLALSPLLHSVLNNGWLLINCY